MSSYFDYPTDDAPDGDLTFLADRAEADWSVVLDHTELRRFSAGEEVIRAGDDDRALYLLTAGSLAVASGAAFRTIDGPRELVDADPGSLRYRKLVLDEDGRAIGGILLGHPEHVQTVTAAVRESRPMSGWS